MRPNTQALDDPLASVAGLDPMLRMPDVERATGLRRGFIYRMIQRGEFPGPCRLSPRTSGWRASEVRAWIDARPRADAAHSPR